MNTELRKITDYLLLKSPYIQDIGFFHGKMGIAVALYVYANRYHDQLIEEYAWDLFLQVYDGVHVDMPIGLECGLAGIGYGTTLLCELGLMKCDLNEILVDVDARIMERDPRRITDFSVRSAAAPQKEPTDISVVHRLHTASPQWPKPIRSHLPR